jgi:hypothetical protein
MNFQINNTDLLTEPTNHNWVARTRVGYDGNAHPVYVPHRQYQMKWDWMDAASFSQLVAFFQSCSGTVPVTLPAWNSTTGGFAVYTASLEEPAYANSLEGYFGSVSLLILNIR